jgi:hypothetical protein
MKGARAFVTHETLLTLTASDANEPLDPDLTGVLTTRYRIVNDGYDSGWLAYGAPFALSTVPDGFYSVDYTSTDKNLNSEPAKRAEFILDTTSPSTDIELTGPSKTVQAGCYIEPSTSFSLSAVDIGSGVDSTEYRISGSGQDTGWRPYAGSFSLSEYSAGKYLLEYRSADIMANSEQTRSMQLSLVMDDMLPPSAYCVSGFVRDQNTSDPIEGATVRFGDISCVTDETGSYSFLVTNGTHVFDVSADGYDVRSVTVIVSGDDVVRDIGLDVAGNGGSKANSVSVPTAGAIILAVAVVAAILSFLALSRLGVGRRPDEPPPPES